MPRNLTTKPLALWHGGLLFGLALIAAVAASGCAGDSCGDCTTGCCADGECIQPLTQSDTQCGGLGGECQDCTASGMTCDTSRGMCTTGTGTYGDTTQLPGNTTTPIQSNLGTCGDCLGGCCDGATGQCIAENQSCSTAGTTCHSGACQFDNPASTTQSSPDCPGCYAPWECIQGRCVGPVEKCMQSCGGCCSDKGKCYALGPDQSDYACGRGGEMCTDCYGRGQVCNEQRGQCEIGSFGSWEICVVSAKVDGMYSDCEDPNASDADKAPDMYVEFRMGGTYKQTETVAARREGNDWVGAWVSDGACVQVDGDVAGTDGITVVVKDSDWGFVNGCSLWSMDFQDDNLGDCVLYTDGVNFNTGDSFVRLGTGSCRGDLIELEVKFAASPTTR